MCPKIKHSHTHKSYSLLLCEPELIHHDLEGFRVISFREVAIFLYFIQIIACLSANSEWD